LTEVRGSWTSHPTSFSQQWERCDGSGNGCSPIGGATSATYVLVAADIGHAIRVQESATNAAGTGGPASSAATAAVAPAGPSPTPPHNSIAPVVSGTPKVGSTLSAATGTWSGSVPISYAYQWQRCTLACANITRAHGRKFTLAASAVGARIRVVVTASNSAGSARAAASPVGPVAPSVQRVSAALSKLLSPRGKAVRIGVLLHAGGYRPSFAAPSAGRLIVSWEFVPPGTRRARVKPKVLLVATGSATLSRPGTARIRIRLTARGRGLLAGASRLALTARGRFTPPGAASTVVFRPLTLRQS
jgi:hypothetical protein